MLAGALLQVSRDRQNQHRIACHQDWETQLTDHLFMGGYQSGTFGPVPHADRWLFRDFLARYHASFAGQEAELLRHLYLDLDIHPSLPDRLKSGDPKVRAMAAQEIGLFRLDETTKQDPPPVAKRPWRWKPARRLEGYLDLVLPLLDDPVPFVAHVAAKTLAQSQELRFAGPVLAWVMREEDYQRERLLRVLEAFGPGLLPWMKENLEPPSTNPGPWVLYALLAGSHRHSDAIPRLLWLLSFPDTELRICVLKALIILGDPVTYTKVLPLLLSPTWEIRVQAARAVGALGGPSAIPRLLALLSDRVYEVRRTAAQGLADLGHAGAAALRWTSEDPAADRFARDIAKERLDWTDERGHP